MPDLIINDANAYLGDGVWQRTSVLVRDGIIAAVGDRDDLDARASPDVEVRNAGGASVIPGVHDTHVHPPFAGAALLGIDLSPVHDADAYARIIREYAAAHPDEPVLVGSGWYGDCYDGGFPTRWALDEIVPDRPVILTGHDGHGAWVNSRAIEAAGIPEDIVDPSGGRFVRTADGVLTGVLLDTATAAINGIRPEQPDDHLEAAILAAQTHLHSAGITTWHDAAVGKSELGPDTFDAYMALERRGELTAKVVLCQWWDRHRGLEQLEELRGRRDRAASTEHIRANTVKIMQDGMIENRTAAMLEPYTTHPDHRGDSFIEPEELNRIVTALDAEGFQVHIHAVGDRAVREGLDAIESARGTNGAADGRHQITHLDVVDPADTTRFAALGVTVNAQLLWGRTDTEIVERKLPLIGDERAQHHFPYGSLHRAGARIAAGSDWPVSDPNPFWAMHTGTTRLAPASDPHATGPALVKPLLADEALPFAVALDAFTGTAAWVGHLDEVTGRIAPGFAADLVLLDRDVSNGHGLDSVQVVETLADGRTVSRRL
ncbi:putative amidohydrolase YtcJ [Curtobacterium sp. 320]|uniref:amidohydrolase n=1 Tax=Curtobacterium sp. 320 TaxID=2817749 RepID=UPI00285D14D1|nr:amidohydrolase [Curtobacterium sp. 320]MDR6573594.1 putative amidohydrolase YtcJ [Curtobacterium sp. 320]